LLSENLEVHRDSNSQNGSSLGSVRVLHSLTLFYTLKSMRCDSWASFLARTLASPYLGHKPKARVPTMSPKGENNGRIRGWGTFFSSQHFGGRGACWSSEMGTKKSDKQVNYLHKLTYTKQQVG